MSPVTIILLSWPSRVKNISIWRRGRVLGFVEDDDAVVQRPAAHEGERDHLDHVVDHEPLDLLEVHHVVQGIEQRAKVRVDLGLQIAGQKAQPLAGFDGGAGEHDPLGLPVLEHASGGGDGEIRLAGSGRADAERQVVVQDRVDVSLLARRSWA